MFFVIKASDFVHGIQFNIEMYWGEGVNQGSVTALQDDNTTTCMTPFRGGSRAAWATIGSAFQRSSVIVLLMTVPVGAVCVSPEITVAAESSELDIMFECMHMSTTDEMGQVVCSYECHCGSCCSYVHIKVQNRTHGTLNPSKWRLCHVEICVQNWLNAKNHVLINGDYFPLERLEETSAKFHYNILFKYCI